MSSLTKEVEKEFLPLLHIYKDGTVERLMGTPYVPPSPQDPETRVSLKDITISQDPSISAYFIHTKKKFINDPSKDKFLVLPLNLPILVYFHGGGFCFESAFSSDHHRFFNSLVGQGQVVAVSVEYRQAPEHSLPIAYEDCWAALQWVTSHVINDTNAVNKEPWLMNHGDFSRDFFGGDSTAGGNIVHNIAMRAGVESLHGGVKLVGAFLTHPYFWGSKPIRVGTLRIQMHPVVLIIQRSIRLVWLEHLAWLDFDDEMRDRGICYYEELIKSKWEGEAELFQVEGEEHAFHILHFETQNAKTLIKGLASFLLKK
ncbi:hypothetical protein RGQ29_024075 [Quercus rubra]|uniref:Alpha/beta hydrolase fold-3 domain-containing protein n=1 Tax=Quercus rubra TaxID=3512 RepID=A0AAN7F7V7_QUERU|nr:hypothetical protein RGQ29_024075 [Quercus rubra]